MFLVVWVGEVCERDWLSETKRVLGNAQGGE